jgi:hypothetical protein
MVPRLTAPAVLAGLALAGPGAAAGEGPWWENEPLRIIQTNLRQIDADRDPAVIVRQVKDLGANAILFSCGGIRAFYQTELKYHKKAIALEGDFAVEARRIAREEGLRFIGRLDLSKVHAGFREDNPDWFQRGADGVSHEYNGLNIACPNGGYYRGYSHEIIKEVIERVEPDALFFNMFGFTRWDYSGAVIPLCHCDGCQARYRGMHGETLPKDMGPDHADHGKYQEFQAESIRTLVDELKGLIHRESEGRTAFFTYVDTADMRRMEANSGLDRRPRTNFFSAAQQVGRFKTMYPKKPVGCTAVNFLDMPYRYSSEPAGLTGMRLVQALATGGELDFYVLGTLDQPDQRGFPAVKRWFGHHAAHEDLYFQSRSIARVALVRRGGQEFQGAWNLLVERGVPFDVVDLREDRAAEGFYRRYELMWSPGLFAEGSEESRVLERYVREGGRLVATADADKPVPSFFGVEKTGSLEAPNATYYRLVPRDAFPEDVRSEVVMARDTILECTPAEGTRALLKLIPPHSDGPPELAYFTEADFTDTSGLFLRPHGKGQVAFFPWSLGRQYEKYAVPAQRELAEDTFGLLGVSEPPVAVGGGRPVFVTARRSRDGSTLLVNLVNLTSNAGGRMAETEVIADVAVKVRLDGVDDLPAARLLVAGESLGAGSGGYVVPRLGLLETLAIPLR